MEVQRLPRRLFYRWEETGEEIEYPTNLPDPAPEIICDTVQITVPPAIPGWFILYGQARNGVWITVAQGWSFAQPRIQVVFWSNNPLSYQVGMLVMGWNGVWTVAPGSAICINWYVTPGSTQQPRRDLLVGTDRIINPTINAPCPTWRIAGGNCPPNSLDCGNCCLDCSALNNAINGLTSAVLPYSSWRPR